MEDSNSTLEIKKIHKSMGRPKKNLDAEERAKREIANSNERRRMQSINSGFSCLRQILRQHNNIEKHSKAAILHQSANYIKKLEQDINHFTEQNQLLKNFVDNYHKQLAIKAKDTEESEERVDVVDDTTDDTEEETAYVPPNKKMKRSDEASESPSASDSHSSDSIVMSNKSVVQSPQELTQILEKEVAELRSLLERERQLRTGLEVKQKIGFQPNGWPQMIGVSAHLPFQMNGFPISHIPSTSISTPLQLTAGYHIKCEDRPLDLKTHNNSLNGYSMKAIQHTNYILGQYPYNRSLDHRSKYTSRATANMSAPETSLKNQGNVRQMQKFLKNYYKNCRQNKAPVGLPHSQTVQDKDQSVPLPLVKRPAIEEAKQTTSSTSVSQQSSNIDTTEPMSSSMSRSDSGVNENLELILKAIQHLEGEEVSKADPSDYVKQLAEKLSFNSTSVLKHLLSNDSGNNQMSKPTDHSMDSLL